MPTPNSNLVSRKQWKKWSEPSRYVFNEMYETMIQSQKLFNSHPKAKKMEDEHWVTVAWNAAWTAADAADAAVAPQKAA
jgi:hypothetical protein